MIIFPNKRDNTVNFNKEIVMKYLFWTTVDTEGVQFPIKWIITALNVVRCIFEPLTLIFWIDYDILD